jgi:hypothetical protein
MTEQDRINLIIEKKAFQEVVYQLSKGCDARMSCQLDSFLCGIEDKIREIDIKLKMPQEHEDYVRKLAHDNWVRDGNPNGEEFRDSPFGRMKIKNIHWLKAELVAAAAINHNAGGDW